MRHEHMGHRIQRDVGLAVAQLEMRQMCSLAIGASVPPRDVLSRQEAVTAVECDERQS